MGSLALFSRIFPVALLPQKKKQGIYPGITELQFLISLMNKITGMKIIFSLTAAFLAFQLHAQTLSKTLSKDRPVKGLNWGSMSINFVDGYWEMVRPQLEKKFTKKIVDSIETHAMSMYQPSGFDSDNDLKAKSNIYLVAEFNNMFGGTFHGVDYILWVPYDENGELWKFDKTHPNDFFLVFPKEAVELEK